MKISNLSLLYVCLAYLTNCCNALNQNKKHETIYFSLNLPDYKKNVEKNTKISAQAEATLHTAKIPILGEISTNISLKTSKTTHKRLNQFADYLDSINLLYADIDLLLDIARRTKQFNLIKKAYNNHDVDITKLQELFSLIISKINLKNITNEKQSKTTNLSNEELLLAFRSIVSEYFHLIINIDKNDDIKKRKHEIEKAFNVRGRLEFINKFFFIFAYLTITNDFSEDLDYAKTIADIQEYIKNIYDYVNSSKSIFKKKRNTEETCISTKHTLSMSFADIIKADITITDNNPYIYKNGASAQISIDFSKLYLIKNTMNITKDVLKNANQSTAETIAGKNIANTDDLQSKLFSLVFSILSKSDSLYSSVESFVDKKLGQKGKFGHFLKNVLDILNLITKELIKDQDTMKLPGLISNTALGLQLAGIVPTTLKRNLILNFNLDNTIEHTPEFIDGRTYSYIDRHIGGEIGLNAASITGKIGAVQDAKREVSIFSNELSLFPIFRKFFDYAFQVYADNNVISKKDFNNFLDIYNMRLKYSNILKNICNDTKNKHFKKQMRNFFIQIPENTSQKAKKSMSTIDNHIKNIACLLFTHYVLPKYKGSFK